MAQSLLVDNLNNRRNQSSPAFGKQRPRLRQGQERTQLVGGRRGVRYHRLLDSPKLDAKARLGEELAHRVCNPTFAGQAWQGEHGKAKIKNLPFKTAQAGRSVAGAKGERAKGEPKARQNASRPSRFANRKKCLQSISNSHPQDQGAKLPIKDVLLRRRSH